MELIDPYELIRYYLVNWKIYPYLESLNIYSFMDYRKISPYNFPELIFQITKEKQKFKLLINNKGKKYSLQDLLKIINIKTLGYIVTINAYSKEDNILYNCKSIDCYPYQQHLKDSVIIVQRKFREKREIEARPPTREYPLGGMKYRELVEKYRRNPLNFGI